MVLIAVCCTSLVRYSARSSCYATVMSNQHVLVATRQMNHVETQMFTALRGWDIASQLRWPSLHQAIYRSQVHSSPRHQLSLFSRPLQYNCRLLLCCLVCRRRLCVTPVYRKRLKLRSRGFHSNAFSFWHCKFDSKIPRGTPCAGASK